MDANVVASTFYHHPVPGFIVTGIVCGGMFVAMAGIAWHNYGPNGVQRKQDPDAPAGAEPPRS